MRGLMVVLLLAAAIRLPAADSLVWTTNRVDADIQSLELPELLAQVAASTGWQVYLEPGTTRTVSTKFKGLPPGEALRLMLGDLNFALVPQTNGNPRLLVFHTSQGNATVLIHAAKLNANAARTAKVIPNELVVRLKPGVNIDELAQRLGAKVIGRIDGLNAYLLQFEDQAAADAARAQLADNADVQNVDSNYVVDRPPSALNVNSASLPPVQLKLNPPDSSGKVIVGLVDTAVQPLGNDLDKFLSKSLSVVGDTSNDPNSPTHGTSMFENILRAASTAENGSSSMQVISVDVYGSNPTTSTFNVAAGIAQAVNNGANIVNLSLGSPGDSQVLHDILQQAAQQGIIVFAAAGNDASPEPYFPAAYPEVTSVTAASAPGQLASYANYGSFIKLMAPGTSLVYYGNNAWIVSGTSSATAFITGLTAGTADAQHTSVTDAAKAVGNTPVFKFPPPQ